MDRETVEWVGSPCLISVGHARQLGPLTLTLTAPDIGKFAVKTMARVVLTTYAGNASRAVACKSW